MHIDSPRFGTLAIAPEKIIEFPRGLVGFENCQRFSLFHPEGEAPRFFILQSLDDVDMAFQIIDPAHLGLAFEIEMSAEETALIGFDDPQDIVVAVIVWQDESRPDGGRRANLQAPVIINTRKRLGLQHLFHKLTCTVSDT